MHSLLFCSINVTHPLSILLIISSTWTLYFLCFHPLANIPGPKLAALTTLWKTYAVYQGNFPVKLQALHAKYGKRVRIGPNEVSIASARDIGRIYGYRGKFIKGPFYRGWALFGTGHFSERNEEKHRISRNRVASIYSLNNVLLLEGQCDMCSSVLFQKLDELAERHAIADISHVLAAYAYDSMARMGFGDSLGKALSIIQYQRFSQIHVINQGFLSDEIKAKDAINKLSKAHRIIVILGTMTTINWFSSFKPFVKIVLKLLGQKGPQLFLAYAQSYVQERLRLRTSDPLRYEQHQDLLRQFLEHKYNNVGNDNGMIKNLPVQEIVKNCITLFMAGADTTSASMIAFLRYIYAHPPSLTLLRKEIDDAVREGRIVLPLTYAASKTLPFYNACLKEAMRLNPVIGMPLQRVVPKGGIWINDDYYPEGTWIGMFPQEVHTDPSVYGDDAREWNPSRWLTGNKNELERYNLTFGQGNRVCLGKNIALMEMSKLLAMIVYRYDLEILDEETPCKFSGSWFRTPHDFLCRVKERQIVFD